MKILHVIPYFTPQRGGDVNVCYMLSKNLYKKGHDITVITTDFEFDDRYAKALQDSGVEVIAFPYLVNIGLFLPSPRMNIWLKENIEGFDIVHLHDFRSYQNSIAGEYARKARVPYVLQAHGDLPIFTEKQMLKRIYDHAFGIRILRNVSKAIALTKTEFNQYKCAGVAEDKIKIIPNGLDLSEYSNLPQRGDFKKMYSLNENTQLILYVGRLHKSKGIELLIDAFSQILKELDDVQLVLVGPDGGYESEIRNMVRSQGLESQVVMTGFAAPIVKAAAFIDADIFVTPSFLGFPITFLEACLFGKPLITTINGDELDWIHNKIGYITGYRSSDIKEAVITILNDQNLKDRFGAEGMRLASERFTWDRIINEIIDTYESCIS